ncbi:hypothetical protein Micbo1qcDRAFT_178935 [Microdochium bolleyi]|uniref:Uncharacterized protein n=1 Tax=Microdochium bolleyi TaxID=196109 RepID=A0A136IR83_9PEZI|nr:hypothetical protein Micbo1qcDRAFT_178935 [Microdochium bolleyi]
MPTSKQCKHHDSRVAERYNHSITASLLDTLLYYGRLHLLQIRFLWIWARVMAIIQTMLRDLFAGCCHVNDYIEVAFNSEGGPVDMDDVHLALAFALRKKPELDKQAKQAVLLIVPQILEMLSIIQLIQEDCDEHDVSGHWVYVRRDQVMVDLDAIARTKEYLKKHCNGTCRGCNNQPHAVTD